MTTDLSAERKNVSNNRVASEQTIAVKMRRRWTQWSKRESMKTGPTAIKSQEKQQYRGIWVAHNLFLPISRISFDHSNEFAWAYFRFMMRHKIRRIRVATLFTRRHNCRPRPTDSECLQIKLICLFDMRMEINIATIHKIPLKSIAITTHTVQWVNKWPSDFNISGQ